MKGKKNYFYLPIEIESNLSETSESCLNYSIEMNYSFLRFFVAGQSFNCVLTRFVFANERFA